MTFQVPAGVEAFVVAGEWPDFHLSKFTTKQLNIFTEPQVAVDPTGRYGKHIPSSMTVGGNYARLGFYAFASNGRHLVVHKDHVTIVGEAK